VAARLRARGQSARYQIVLQLHLGGQGEHVSAFLPGDRDRVLGERAGDFLQRQAVLADLDEAWSSWACSLSAYDLTCRSAYDLTCWFAGSLAG
jgi:hypothetical protein